MGSDTIGCSMFGVPLTSSTRSPLSCIQLSKILCVRAKRRLSSSSPEASWLQALSKFLRHHRFHAITSPGWGTFNIAVLLKFKEGTTLRTSWKLQFDHPDASGELDVPASIACASLPQPPPPPTAQALADPGEPSPAPPPPPPPPPPAAAVSAEPGDRDGAESHSDIFGIRGSVGCGSEDEALPEEASEATEPLPGPGPPPELLRARSLEMKSVSIISCFLSEASHVALPVCPISQDTSEGKADDDPSRAELCKRLREAAFMDPSDPKFMFGRAYVGPLQAPKVLWRSSQPPRKDHSCPKWLTATEFEDQPEARHMSWMRWGN